MFIDVIGALYHVALNQMIVEKTPVQILGKRVENNPCQLQKKASSDRDLMYVVEKKYFLYLDQANIQCMCRASLIRVPAWRFISS